MNNIIKSLLIFVTGAAVGSGVTYAVIKYKLEKSSEEDEWNNERTERLRKEKEEATETKNQEQEDETVSERIQQIHNKPDISTLASEYHEYHDYTKDYRPEDKSTTDPESPMFLADEAEKEAEEFDEDDDYDETVWDNPPTEKRGPYRVLPERFGIIESYDTVILHYYTDGILAEENGEIVNIEDFVGEENIEALIDDDEHEIFICNPRYGCYYDVMEMLSPYYKD